MFDDYIKDCEFCKAYKQCYSEETRIDHEMMRVAPENDTVQVCDSYKEELDEENINEK